MSKTVSRLIALSLVLIALTGCFRRRSNPEPVQRPQTPLHSAEISAWEPISIRKHPSFGQRLGAWSTWHSHLERTYKGLQFTRKLPASQVEPAWDRDQMLDSLSKMLRASKGNEKDFWANLERDFVALRAVSEEYHPAFFTGYYSPIFRGSRRPSDLYAYPVYAPPADLKTNAAFYTRQAVDRGGALQGKGLEICYLESPLDVFLLQVQGSATVIAPDGERIGLGYGGSNGLAYASLGKMMIERGLSTAADMSLGTIVKAYHEDRKKIEDLMMLNERYIFFQESDGQPRGSTGAIVEGFHTLATERASSGLYRFLPHQPALVSLSMPGMGKTTLPVLCQDTGSAIVGALRADLYIGEGKVAERLAGKLKHRGDLYLLWPKSVAFPNMVGGVPVKNAGMMPTP